MAGGARAFCALNSVPTPLFMTNYKHRPRMCKTPIVMYFASQKFASHEHVIRQGTDIDTDWNPGSDHSSLTDKHARLRT